MPVDRRVFLVGAPLAGLAAAAGIVVYRVQTADGPAADVSSDYDNYLAEVAADYRAGKLGEIHGWIVSETEARTYRDMLSD